MNVSDSKVILFAPNRWGTLERFKHFHEPTYPFTWHTQQALSGAANHFNKAVILLQVSREHAKTLPEDTMQLEKYGYTPAQRGRELSALIESILLELYSSVDCTRAVITSIYQKHEGVRQSTRKFFQSVAKGKVADTVPAEIRDAFASAQWYMDLLRIRDALTHWDIGSCHLDKKSGTIFYMHPGLGTNNSALVIEDIFSHVQGLVTHINQFIGKLFHYLNGTLKDDEVWQWCGIFGGRLYSRWVRPSEAKNFNSGRCDAFKWFEKEENPNCPFMQECEAYGRRSKE